tara:strand:+ start:165 stop:677 length:513 start_codon:yes stop_codon:yes gene_type:complete
MTITDYLPTEYIKREQAPQNEETLLVPHEDEISIDVFLDDVRCLQHLNQFNEYYFTFIVATPVEGIRLEEAMDSCVTKVMRRKDYLSSKEAVKCFKKNKRYYCSQLYLPKLTGAPERIEELRGNQATLKLHFRDDPQGNIYLQCGYCDVYDVDNGAEPVGVDDPNGDFDF